MCPCTPRPALVLSAAFFTALVCGAPAAAGQNRAELERERELDLASRVSELRSDRRYEAARAAADSLLQMRKQMLRRLRIDPRGHPWVADGYATLAGIYDDLRDYARADSLYRDELKQAEEALGPADVEVIQRSFRLVFRYRDQGRHALADSLYAMVMGRAEQAFGSTSPEVIASYREQYQNGPLWAGRSEDDRQSDLFEQLVAGGHRDVALALGDSIVVRRREELERPVEEQMPDALRGLPQDGVDVKTYRQAIVVARQIRLIESLSSLASLYEEEGLRARADSLRLEAAALSGRMAVPASPPEIAAFLDSLPARVAAIEDSVARSTVGRRTAPVPDDRTARPAPTDRVEAVVQLLRSEAEEQERVMEGMHEHSPESESLVLPLWRAYAYSAVDLNVRSAPRRTDVADLALTLVLRYKGSDQDRAAALWRRFQNTPRERRDPLLDSLAVLRAELSALFSQPATLGDSVQRRAAFARLDVRHTALEQQLGSDRRYAAPAGEQPVTRERVQAAIPADGALVELVWYDPLQGIYIERPGDRPRYAAYVLKHEGVPEVVDLGEAASLDSLVQSFSAALADRSSQNARALGRALDERILEPLRPRLGDKSHLLISPDGALSLVPFAPLVGPDGRYLVERYSVTYLTSGRDLLLPAFAPATDPAVPLIIANPDFSRARPGVAGGGVADSAAAGRRGRASPDLGSMTWAPLPTTAREGEAVAEMLPNARLVTGADATEALVMGTSSPRILHLATHGFFVPDPTRDTIQSSTHTFPWDVPRVLGVGTMLRSGLAMAGANARDGGQGQDGILTALEISGLDLRGTELVVLSACETGLGDVRVGEGVYGLRRALALSGARTQVMSLWRVDDTATQDQMLEYYGRLRQGEGRGEALRRVQLGMLATPHRAHPYYWAAFVVIGDWTPLQHPFP
jgi:CHAT domain-containing protein